MATKKSLDILTRFQRETYNGIVRNQKNENLRNSRNKPSNFIRMFFQTTEKTAINYNHYKQALQ